MSTFENKFKTIRDDWETPPNIFNPINDGFNFDIDLAASHTNYKVPFYYTKEMDALSFAWQQCSWLNPPYGMHLHKWIEKAYHDSQQYLSTIVVLLPCRTNTTWWHNYCMKAKQIYFIKGRPVFVGAEHGLPQPLCLVVFKPHLHQTHYETFHLT